MALKLSAWFSFLNEFLLFSFASFAALRDKKLDTVPQ
jgi:hypothetical protein